MNWPKKTSILIILLSGLDGWATLGAAENEAVANRAAAIELRENIDQWVKIEDLISKESSDWQAEKLHMQRLLDLHQTELTQLSEFLSQAAEDAVALQARRDEIEQEKKKLNSARSEFILRLQKLKPRALALYQRFPSPLQTRTEDLFNSIRELEAKESPRELTQAIVGLLNAAGEFNASIFTSNEVRAIDGKRVKVRTLYIGLAIAYFRAENGKSAGIGIPSNDGWQWQSRPELSASIAQAIAVANRESRPAFISLPVKLKP